MPSNFQALSVHPFPFSFLYQKAQRTTAWEKKRLLRPTASFFPMNLAHVKSPIVAVIAQWLFYVFQCRNNFRRSSGVGAYLRAEALTAFRGGGFHPHYLTYYSINRRTWGRDSTPALQIGNLWGSGILGPKVRGSHWPHIQVSQWFSSCTFMAGWDNLYKASRAERASALESILEVSGLHKYWTTDVRGKQEKGPWNLNAHANEDKGGVG